jgi:hypothetical protein
VFRGLEGTDTVAASEAGSWLVLRDPFTDRPIVVDGEPLRLKLAGPDSDRYQKMIDENQERLGKARSLSPTGRVETEALNRITAETMAQMVLDWSGFRDDAGTAMPCTPDNVERLFRYRPRLRMQAFAFVTDIANFRVPNEGPSSSPSPPGSGETSS